MQNSDPHNSKVLSSTTHSGSTDTLRIPKGHRRTNSSFASLEEEYTPRNSSLQKIWAEDYYSDFADAGGTTLSFEGGEGTRIPSPPLPATLTSRPFPRSIPLTAEEESCPPRQTRTHQRSLTALLPSLRPLTSRTNSRSPERKSHSPTKEKKREELEEGFMPTLTGDNDGKIKVADKSRGGLASWFTGSSAPVQLGLPVSDQESLSSTPTMSSSRSTSPERPAAKLAKRRPTLPTLESSSSTNTTPSKTTASSGTSRFNFFSSPKTPVQKTIQLPSDLLQSDEFLTLDITSALFPTGSPSSQDPFSPSSFKNLLMNAEGLLLKLQTAYKLRTLSLHELELERQAEKDELEEAETRAQCLRAQLEDLAQRITSKDKAIEELALDLAREKQARREEKEAREKSIALVRSSREKHNSCCAVTDGEDLGISTAAAARRKRISADSTTSLSAEGESDAESGGGESVFSRSRSPTLTSSSVSVVTMESTPEIGQATFGRVLSIQNHPQVRELRPKLVQQQSTFQKILKGIASNGNGNGRDEEAEVDRYGGIGEGGMSCSNCRGKDASVAWDAVGLLRAENKGLKERVGTLEGAVEGALDLCAGLRL